MLLKDSSVLTYCTPSTCNLSVLPLTHQREQLEVQLKTSEELSDNIRNLLKELLEELKRKDSQELTVTKWLLTLLLLGTSIRSARQRSTNHCSENSSITADLLKSNQEDLKKTLEELFMTGLLERMDQALLLFPNNSSMPTIWITSMELSQFHSTICGPHGICQLKCLRSMRNGKCAKLVPPKTSLLLDSCGDS